MVDSPSKGEFLVELEVEVCDVLHVELVGKQYEVYSGELVKEHCVVLLVEKIRTENSVMLYGEVSLDDDNQDSHHVVPSNFEDAKFLVLGESIAL